MKNAKSVTWNSGTTQGKTACVELIWPLCVCVHILCMLHIYIYIMHIIFVFLQGWKPLITWLPAAFCREHLPRSVNRTDLLCMWVTLPWRRLLPVRPCLIYCRGESQTGWEAARRVEVCHCFSRELNSSFRKSAGWLLTGVEVSELAPQLPSRKILLTSLHSLNSWLEWT